MTRYTRARFSLLAAAGVLALGTSPTLAQDANALPEARPDSPESQQGEAKEEKLICRTEKVIGSRAKKRKTCLTRAQWEEVARRGNAFARSVVESGRTGMWDVPPGG